MEYYSIRPTKHGIKSRFGYESLGCNPRVKLLTYSTILGNLTQHRDCVIIDVVWAQPAAGPLSHELNDDRGRMPTIARPLHEGVVSEENVVECIRSNGEVPHILEGSKARLTAIDGFTKVCK